MVVGTVLPWEWFVVPIVGSLTQWAWISSLLSLGAPGDTPLMPHPGLRADSSISSLQQAQLTVLGTETVCIK